MGGGFVAACDAWGVVVTDGGGTGGGAFVVVTDGGGTDGGAFVPFAVGTPASTTSPTKVAGGCDEATTGTSTAVVRSAPLVFGGVINP